MMNWGRLRIVLALGALLACVLFVSARYFPENADSASGEEAHDSAIALINAVSDKIGLTQRAELLAWLDMTGEGLDGSLLEDTSVWVSRNGHVYHSFPLCGGMKSPVQMRLGEALDAGYIPCGECWTAASVDEP